MRQMMVRAFLLVILAQLNPVTSKEDSEKTNFLPSPGHDSYGLQNKADIKDSRSSHPAVYCDRESLIIEISPTQRTDFNLIIDDKPQVFVKHVLEQCSHVELQPSSTFRIFYEGCYLHDWVAHKKQYTVTIGHPDSNLKGAMVISETCPSLTSGALLQIPAVTCAADATIVKLPAKVLKYAGFQDLDAPITQEKHASPDLTQWRNGDHLFIKAENPRTKDYGVLVLQYTDRTDNLYTAKVSCIQYHPKRWSNKGISSENLFGNSGMTSSYDFIDNASDIKPSRYYDVLPQSWIQELWDLPAIKLEPYRSSTRETPPPKSKKHNSETSVEQMSRGSMEADTDNADDTFWGFPTIPAAPYMPVDQEIPITITPGGTVGHLNKVSIVSTTIPKSTPKMTRRTPADADASSTITSASNATDTDRMKSDSSCSKAKTTNTDLTVQVSMTALTSTIHPTTSNKSSTATKTPTAIQITTMPMMSQPSTINMTLLVHESTISSIAPHTSRRKPSSLAPTSVGTSTPDTTSTTKERNAVVFTTKRMKIPVSTPTAVRFSSEATTTNTVSTPEVSNTSQTSTEVPKIIFGAQTVLKISIAKKPTSLVKDSTKPTSAEASAQGSITVPISTMYRTTTYTSSTAVKTPSPTQTTTVPMTIQPSTISTTTPLVQETTISITAATTARRPSSSSLGTSAVSAHTYDTTSITPPKTTAVSSTKNIISALPSGGKCSSSEATTKNIVSTSEESKTTLSSSKIVTMINSQPEMISATMPLVPETIISRTAATSARRPSSPWAPTAVLRSTSMSSTEISMIIYSAPTSFKILTAKKIKDSLKTTSAGSTAQVLNASPTFTIYPRTSYKSSIAVTTSSPAQITTIPTMSQPSTINTTSLVQETTISSMAATTAGTSSLAPTAVLTSTPHTTSATKGRNAVISTTKKMITSAPPPTAISSSGEAPTTNTVSTAEESSINPISTKIPKIIYRARTVLKISIAKKPTSLVKDSTKTSRAGATAQGSITVPISIMYRTTTYTSSTAVKTPSPTQTTTVPMTSRPSTIKTTPLVRDTTISSITATTARRTPSSLRTAALSAHTYDESTTPTSTTVPSPTAALKMSNDAMTNATMTTSARTTAQALITASSSSVIHSTTSYESSTDVRTATAVQTTKMPMTSQPATIDTTPLVHETTIFSTAATTTRRPSSSLGTSAVSADTYDTTSITPPTTAVSSTKNIISALPSGAKSSSSEATTKNIVPTSEESKTTLSSSKIVTMINSQPEMISATMPLVPETIISRTAATSARRPSPSSLGTSAVSTHTYDTTSITPSTTTAVSIIKKVISALPPGANRSSSEATTKNIVSTSEESKTTLSSSKIVTMIYRDPTALKKLDAKENTDVSLLPYSTRSTSAESTSQVPMISFTSTIYSTARNNSYISDTTPTVARKPAMISATMPLDNETMISSTAATSARRPSSPSLGTSAVLAHTYDATSITPPTTTAVSIIKKILSALPPGANRSSSEATTKNMVPTSEESKTTLSSSKIVTMIYRDPTALKLNAKENTNVSLLPYSTRSTSAESTAQVPVISFTSTIYSIARNNSYISDTTPTVAHKPAMISATMPLVHETMISTTAATYARRPSSPWAPTAVVTSTPDTTSTTKGKHAVVFTNKKMKIPVSTPTVVRSSNKATTTNTVSTAEVSNTIPTSTEILTIIYGPRTVLKTSKAKNPTNLVKDSNKLTSARTSTQVLITAQVFVTHPTTSTESSTDVRTPTAVQTSKVPMTSQSATIDTMAPLVHETITANTAADTATRTPSSSSLSTTAVSSRTYDTTPTMTTAISNTKGMTISVQRPTPENFNSLTEATTTNTAPSTEESNTTTKIPTIMYEASTGFRILNAKKIKDSIKTTSAGANAQVSMAALISTMYQTTTYTSSMAVKTPSPTQTTTVPMTRQPSTIRTTKPFVHETTISSIAATTARRTPSLALIANVTSTPDTKSVTKGRNTFVSTTKKVITSTPFPTAVSSSGEAPNTNTVSTAEVLNTNSTSTEIPTIIYGPQTVLKIYMAKTPRLLMKNSTKTTSARTTAQELITAPSSVMHPTTSYKSSTDVRTLSKTTSAGSIAEMSMTAHTSTIYSTTSHKRSADVTSSPAEAATVPMTRRPSGISTTPIIHETNIFSTAAATARTPSSSLSTTAVSTHTFDMSTTPPTTTAISTTKQMTISAARLKSLTESTSRNAEPTVPVSTTTPTTTTPIIYPTARNNSSISMKTPTVAQITTAMPLVYENTISLMAAITARRTLSPLKPKAAVTTISDTTSTTKGKITVPMTSQLSTINTTMAVVHETAIFAINATTALETPRSQSTTADNSSKSDTTYKTNRAVVSIVKTIIRAPPPTARTTTAPTPTARTTTAPPPTASTTTAPPPTVATTTAPPPTAKTTIAPSPTVATTTAVKTLSPAPVMSQPATIRTTMPMGRYLISVFVGTINS